MDTSFYKYGSQKIDADDCAAVLEALQRDELTGGSLVEQFEEELGSYLKIKTLLFVTAARQPFISHQKR